LAGSLFGLGLASASVAQTTVSGNLDLAYHAVSSNATAGGSYRAVGRETQINIANKGKLSNGMDYAAGFSWELEGGESLGGTGNNDGANGANENVYIDFFYNKDSYVSISNDHVPNSDVTLTNLVGWGYLGGQGIGNKTSLYPTSLNTSGYGVGISHNFGPMRLSGTYVPGPDKEGAGTNDTGHTLTSTTDTGGNSKLEITARGDLGVKGLDLMLAVGRQDKTNNSISGLDQDPNGQRASIKYNAGNITVAADMIKVEGQNITSGATPTATLTGNHTLKGKSAGIAYAINKDLSIGYTRSKADTNQPGFADEKVNHYAIGYNLGAVTAQIQLRDAEGVAGTTGKDGEGEILAVKLSTRF
jgi:hypothetical protein